MSWWENGRKKQISPCFCQTQIGRVGTGKRCNFLLLTIRSKQNCFPIKPLHIADESWYLPDKIALVSAKNIVKMAELKIVAAMLGTFTIYQFTTFHVIVKSFLLSFNCHRYLLSSRSVFFFSCLKDIWWFLHLVLNSVAVIPHTSRLFHRL